PLPFSIFGSFYPNVRIFFYVKILVGDIEGGAKKKPTILVFFCWAQFFAPPSEWRPRRPPIPPVGKTAPARVIYIWRRPGHTTHTRTRRTEVAVNFLFCLYPIPDRPSSRILQEQWAASQRPGTKSRDPSVLVRDGQESVLFFCMFFLLGFLVEETPCEHGE